MFKGQLPGRIIKSCLEWLGFKSSSIIKTTTSFQKLLSWEDLDSLALQREVAPEVGGKAAHRGSNGKSQNVLVEGEVNAEL